MTETIRYAFGQSSLGAFIAASSDRGLVAFEFAEQGPSLVKALGERFADAQVVEDVAGLAGTVGKLIDIVDHPDRDPDLALDPRGTDYEMRVWDALRRIPAGRTVSYGEIAAGLGAPREAREVAEACAANAIAILIPCHRVVKKDGALAGYRWGFKRKRELVAREQAASAFQLA
ncbi:methylated-DNA--[protein]-cysteine S-methyltransferase [Phreatobacter stygius]|uniref:methylated-DNA--[protein]-cysteine S-methyltransferase n=1 Tax=Phreatobacter stygius TaxID=1940610 RepID=A0A4D7B9L4_9HYPH|nr:methylated-DNA--[protein]-cysteine S-methyltransferase [Phreatobacter stygius]QCI66868.1 methylated-DNA--[protein]-cysteine S-methyltransferase [Phreatobacter stygius]